MQTRLLTNDDLDLLDAYLKPHTAFAFFIRSNAHKGGLDYHGHPFQAEVFGAFQGDQLCGVLSHTWIGSLQIFVTEPSAIKSLAEAWRAHHCLKPRKIEVVLGPRNHVTCLCDELRLGAQDLREGGRDETLFRLNMGTMKAPPQIHDPAFIIRRATPEDSETLIPWRYQYYMEALRDPGGEDARRRAEANINGMIHEKNIFVLEHLGRIVSFCGCGGYLPDWRGIGPVWTPVELRGRGYARIVTAGALNIVKAGGVEHAVLFSENPQATRVYEALGFQKIGDWKLDFLISPDRAFA